MIVIEDIISVIFNTLSIVRAYEGKLVDRRSYWTSFSNFVSNEPLVKFEYSSSVIPWLRNNWLTDSGTLDRFL